MYVDGQIVEMAIFLYIVIIFLFYTTYSVFALFKNCLFKIKNKKRSENNSLQSFSENIVLNFFNSYSFKKSSAYLTCNSVAIANPRSSISKFSW